ncbi:hypothetical protein Tco_1494272 [Tanacetum coccineum]
MADENLPAPVPTRSDDQIRPFAAWVPIGKSNHLSTLIFLDRYYVEIVGDLPDFSWMKNCFHTGSQSYEGSYGKTSGHDRPKYPVLQMLWGIITSQSGSPTKKGMKDKPHIIPYCRFTKLIICHLGRIHNIHQRSASPFHLAEEDLRLGNLKFVSKGEEDEVFGMSVPNELISNNIRNAPYYNAYLEMVVLMQIMKVTPKSKEEKDGHIQSATQVQVQMEMEIPCASGVNFITACSYSTATSKDLMKAQVYVSKLPQL